MLDKIQSYFGLTTMPFGRSLAPGMLFRSNDHAQSVARIGYGITTRGITVITGEVGVGKTVAETAHAAELARGVNYAALTGASDQIPGQLDLLTDQEVDLR